MPHRASTAPRSTAPLERRACASPSTRQSHEGDAAPPYTEGSGVGLIDTATGAEGLSRCPDGGDTDVNNQDFLLLALTPGAADACAPPDIGTCGDSLEVPIHQIQGAGTASPLAGTEQVIEAVVVGDFQGPAGLNGFFMQEEDVDADADPVTSEGLFVFDPSAIDVAPGDVVRVRGTVAELSGLTGLTSVNALVLCSNGAPVTPASLSLPVAALDQLEALEGMLVSLPQALYVTDHFNLGRFGEVVLSAGARLFNPTQRFLPGPEALLQKALNDRSQIQLDDGSSQQNPLVVPYLGADGTLRIGDRVSGVTGVLGFSGGSYELHPTAAPSFTRQNARPAAAPALGGLLRVGSLNLGNYFTTLNTGGALCGPAADQLCRGANSAEELERQRTKLVSALTRLDADVVGLVELENSASDAAVADLVDGFNAVSGAGTWTYLATGLIGADAIRAGFIYKPAVLTPVGNRAVLDSSADPIFLDDKNRPVLAQTFREGSTQDRLTIAVAHLKSKGSPCDDVGDPDLGDGQENCNVTRTRAAQAIASWLTLNPTGSGSTDFLILGDLNCYAKEDPIAALELAAYTNLVGRFAGADAYSFVLGGQSGTLDYALASPTLNARAIGAATDPIDADEPTILDYNTEFKSAGALALFSPDEFRATDHDPILIGLAAVDSDGDGFSFGFDNCPYFANPGQSERDGNGRGNACECGDQNSDGTVNVLDLIAINLAIFTPALVTPLCDAGGSCNVQAIIAANIEIFSPGSTSTCTRQPAPGP